MDPLSVLAGQLRLRATTVLACTMARCTLFLNKGEPCMNAGSRVRAEKCLPHDPTMRTGLVVAVYVCVWGVTMTHTF